MQNVLAPGPAEVRLWHPHRHYDRGQRAYRVSFRVGEAATWDHRFHDLDGRELGVGELRLSATDRLTVEASCDSAVGRAYIGSRTAVAAE